MDGSVLVLVLLTWGCVAAIGALLFALHREKPIETPLEVTVALEVAIWDAARRGQRAIHPSHVGLALLLDETLGEGRDLRALEATIAAYGQGERRRERPHGAQPVHDAIAAATRRAKRERLAAISPRHLLDALAEHDGAVAAALAAPAVQPSPPSAGEAYRVAAAEMSEVFALNDDKTPMAAVVDTLKRHFELPELRAMHVMLTTHCKGRARIGAFPSGEARARVDAAIADLRAQGFPLELEVTGG